MYICIYVYKYIYHEFGLEMTVVIPPKIDQFLRITKVETPSRYMVRFSITVPTPDNTQSHPTHLLSLSELTMYTQWYAMYLEVVGLSFVSKVFLKAEICIQEILQLGISCGLVRYFVMYRACGHKLHQEQQYNGQTTRHLWSPSTENFEGLRVNWES